jgi:hypothetical protein
MLYVSEMYSVLHMKKQHTVGAKLYKISRHLSWINESEGVYVLELTSAKSGCFLYHQCKFRQCAQAVQLDLKVNHRGINGSFQEDAACTWSITLVSLQTCSLPLWKPWRLRASPADRPAASRKEGRGHAPHQGRFYQVGFNTLKPTLRYVCLIISLCA